MRNVACVPPLHILHTCIPPCEAAWYYCAASCMAHSSSAGILYTSSFDMLTVCREGVSTLKAKPRGTSTWSWAPRWCPAITRIVPMTCTAPCFAPCYVPWPPVLHHALDPVLLCTLLCLLLCPPPKLLCILVLLSCSASSSS